MSKRHGGAIRYAVIGAGHIAQVAVLPAFANAENSELVALVSGDDEKRRELGERYEIEHCVHYDDLDDLLGRGIIDAVYITVPNHLHCRYALKAAAHEVHVLCEKPLAVTSAQCHELDEAVRDAGVYLMTAYRLHFERANLEVMEIARGGELGDVRLFESVFTQNVKEGDVRLMPIEKGGGSLYDMGVYCINTARQVFREEPHRVTATQIMGSEERFAECDEATSVILEFSSGRIATFTTSFNAEHISSYRILGTTGELVMDPAYEYADQLSYRVHANGHQTQRQFSKRDQFGPQLAYFSDCIRNGRRPEPDAYEGLLDIRIIEAAITSAREKRSVSLSQPDEPVRRPDLRQHIERPGFDKPPEIHASSPRQ